MGDGGLGVTQVGSDAAHLRAVDDMKGTAAAVNCIIGAHIKRQYRPAQPGLLAHGQRMLRVRCKPRVINARHLGVGFQPLRQNQCRGTLRMHANGQCFHALEHHPGIERRQVHACTADQRCELLVDDGAWPADSAGHDAALAIQELGARVDDEVGTKFCRALQGRRGKAVVHHQQHTRRVRHVGQCLDVAQIGQRVGRCFGKQQACFWPHGRFPGSGIGLGHKARLHTEACELAADQLHGGTEHGLGAHHMVARFQQTQTHQQNGRHAAGGANGSFGAFQSSQALLKGADRRVGGARIGVPIFLTRKTACRCRCIGLHKAAGQVQRFGVFPILAARHRLAHSQGVRVKAGRQIAAHGEILVKGG